jgi:AsmA protein
MKRLRRALWIALVAVVAIGLIAPKLDADRLRPRIQAALEAAFNRPVQIEEVHLNLFTGPGFTVTNVLIGDDPAAGIEPFAHVETMQARVRWISLLRGKLAFSSLRMDSPSVNLVKMPAGPWNIQPLLDHTAGINSTHAHDVPDIQIRDGRLNFKFGDTKSVFYISAADIDVYPNESGDVVIRFSGAPARTDRGSQNFGELSARGMLHSSSNGEDQLNLGLRLERTAISEMVRLFNGRDMGVHGFAVANARLAGPLSKLEITGDLNITDIHRWDLMPPKGEGWNLNYRGLLNLPAHQLDMETVAGPGQIQPVAVKLRVADYLSAPKWAASITFHDLPAASLVETARHMGAPFPPGVQVDGRVNGVIGYSNPGGMQGELALENASVKSTHEASAEFDSARVLFANNAIVFGPADVTMENGQSAGIDGIYALDNSRAALRITTRQLTIAEVESSAEHVISAPPIPLLENLRQGTWRGSIAFERRDDHPGVWSGQYELQNAVMDIPGMATPIRFSNASVEIKDGLIQINRIRARVGAVTLEGDYRYDPAAGHPHRIRLNIPELQLAELESILMPTLRRNEGFLARTFRLRNEALPKWLVDRQVEGDIHVANLVNGESPIGEIGARLVWDGPTIVLSNLDCRLDDMHAQGKLSLNLAKPSPAYAWAGTIENLEYRNGRLDLEGELETNGIAESLLLNIRSQGMFEGQGIELGPETEVGAITGAYKIAPVSGIPRLVLSNIQVEQGSDTFSGQGSSQPDGHIVLELTSGRKQLRLTGMLLPIHPEAPPVR